MGWLAGCQMDQEAGWQLQDWLARSPNPGPPHSYHRQVCYFIFSFFILIDILQSTSGGRKKEKINYETDCMTGI